MQNVIKIIIVSSFLLLLLFIGWMNVTTGHFQYVRSGCCGAGSIEYSEAEQSEYDAMQCAAVLCENYLGSTEYSHILHYYIENAYRDVVLSMSRFDFNK